MSGTGKRAAGGPCPSSRGIIAASSRLINRFGARSADLLVGAVHARMWRQPAGPAPIGPAMLRNAPRVLLPAGAGPSRQIGGPRGSSPTRFGKTARWRPGVRVRADSDSGSPTPCIPSAARWEYSSLGIHGVSRRLIRAKSSLAAGRKVMCGCERRGRGRGPGLDPPAPGRFRVAEGGKSEIFAFILERRQTSYLLRSWLLAPMRARCRRRDEARAASRARRGQGAGAIGCVAITNFPA